MTEITAEVLVGDIRFASSCMGGTQKQEFLTKLAELMTEYKVAKIDVGVNPFEIEARPELEDD